ENELESATGLRFAATGSIQFLRDTSLRLTTGSGTSIELNAPQLSAALPGVDVAVTASRVILGGTSATAAPVAGNGTFHVAASVLEVGGGSLTVSGFGATTLGASDEIIARGAGRVGLTGNVDVVTPVINVARDAEMLLEAPTGHIQMRRPAVATSH